MPLGTRRSAAVSPLCHRYNHCTGDTAAFTHFEFFEVVAPTFGTFRIIKLFVIDSDHIKPWLKAPRYNYDHVRDIGGTRDKHPKAQGPASYGYI